MYNYRVYALITNPNLLKLGIEEHLKLIRVFKECKYNECVFSLIIDPDLLELGTEEHLKLIKFFKEEEYNRSVFDEIKSGCTLEEIKDKHKKVTFDKGLDDIKTLDEMKEYINQLKENKLEDVNIKTLVYKYKK